MAAIYKYYVIKLKFLVVASTMYYENQREKIICMRFIF